MIGSGGRRGKGWVGSSNLMLSCIQSSFPILSSTHLNSPKDDEKYGVLTTDKFPGDFPPTAEATTVAFDVIEATDDTITKATGDVTIAADDDDVRMESLLWLKAKDGILVEMGRCATFLGKCGFEAVFKEFLLSCLMVKRLLLLFSFLLLVLLLVSLLVSEVLLCILLLSMLLLFSMLLSILLLMFVLLLML